jgi:hypothetical protein
MTTLTNQLNLSRRILAQMRSKRASAEDIAAQEAVCNTVEKAKFLDEVSEEIRGPINVTMGVDVLAATKAPAQKQEEMFR